MLVEVEVEVEVLLLLLLLRARAWRVAAALAFLQRRLKVSRSLPEIQPVRDRVPLLPFQ